MRFWLLGVLIILAIVRILTIKSPFSDGQKVRITSRVLMEPQRYERSQKIKLAGLVIFLPLYPAVTYGDEVVVEGEVIKGKLQNPKLISVKESRGFLPKVRERIIAFYQRTLPEPHASLVAGITLGSKASLPEEFWNELKQTGTAHVVVASGTNVTMVAGFLLAILILFLKRRRAIVFVLAGIWIYALLSGFEAPIIRAATMASIVFFAQAMGRLSESFGVLILVGLVMLIINPSWLYDLGFILSFVATASLIAFQPRINKKLSGAPGVFREGLSTTTAAQIGVAPILFVTFGAFNILSPVINALVLWTVPLIMVIGAVSGILGLVHPVLGSTVLYLAYPLTAFFVFVVDVFSKI